MSRKLVFTAPFVITVACDRPVERPRPPPPVAVVPPDAVPEERPAYGPPRELVAELPPLSGDRTIEDVCRHARCNPPPPYPRRKPAAVGPIVRHVVAMQRDKGGTRVRVGRRGPMDQTWRAAFVTHVDNPTELLGGECKIVAWSFQEVECVTALSPEELGFEGRARPVRLVPPQSLIDRIERERASWDDSGGGMRGRVIQVESSGDGMIVKVALGRREGIDKEWTARFVHDGGKPVRGGECVIVRIMERLAVCKTTLSNAQITRNPYVLMQPPRTR